MKKTIFSVALICLTVSAISFAQTAPTSISDMYLISSKAGKVNLIEGTVSVERNNGKSSGLKQGDNLVVGEKASTGSNGKAEVLLNPGSYLRLGENSEFEFSTNDLDDLQLKLNRGSAIFEIITNTDQGFVVGIQTPQTKTLILESGVYRIDVLADNSTKVSVWKGKAQVGEKQSFIVKDGKFAIVKDSQTAIAKFDRDNKDALDTWSKLRAKDLMAINAKLREANLRNSLINSFNNGGWNSYESYGVWVFNRFTGSWCYLPFGGYGNRNPYGWGYNHNIWHCNIPTVIIYTPPTPTVVQGYTGAKRDPRTSREDSQTNATTSNSSEKAKSEEPRSRPVFEGSRGSRNDSYNPSDSRSEPSYNPPTSRSEPSYSPPTSRSEPTYNPPPPPPADTGSKVKDN